MKIIQMMNLLKKNYHGIRPAPGYTACPDHTEKEKIFKFLNASEDIGVSLTENLAMYPNANYFWLLFFTSRK